MGGLTAELADWASGLRFEDLPPGVVELAKCQVLSQLAAVRAGLDHPLGRRLVSAFGPPRQADPRATAAVLAGLGSWLNLDDTAYAGHLSVSTVTTPLAYAAARGLDGARLLTAIVAANECAARLTAAATLGPFRGQTAAHTSIVGAVVGRSHCAGAPADRWVDALTLALSMPPWTLFPAYVGSDARALGAFVPVRIAMDACDAADAGLTGLPDLIEHEDGFLAKFATVPLPEAVVEGLGRRWHTETLSFKVRPGGPGIDVAVDCAVELHRELAGAEVREVEVAASLYTMMVDHACRGADTGPGAPAGLLPLSVRYTVATALLYGDVTVADFMPPATADPARWALAGRIRLVHDEAMTAELLHGTAPFGEALALAGQRARGWVRGFLADRPFSPALPSEDFAHADKPTPAKVTAWLGDGRTLSRRRSIPLGGVGDADRTEQAALVREKFLRHCADERAAEVCADLEHATPEQVAGLLCVLD